ncbi:hypothetical protein [Planococcus koreensis]|uniref:hypothetical protein n=1 Tax=Planococcus koreensis TaxID=112331 RepID=UPI0039FCA8BA
MNVDSSIPIKFEYVSFFTLISLIFLSIVLFQNKIIDKKMWIVFVFIYGNLIYLPILLSYTTLIAANSNGIIAFLLLFFCLINLNERNRLFRALNIYNTVLLIFTLFTATSRTAMAAFFIAIIVFFSINYVKKHLFLSLLRS